MRLQDLILHADKGQKVRYSITTLTDNCRGWVHDSPVMTIEELLQEKHIMDSCVTNYRIENDLLVIYIREYISFSDL